MKRAEQQQMFNRVDGRMLKRIPEEAHWHMEHRPYESKEGKEGRKWQTGEGR